MLTTKLRDRFDPQVLRTLVEVVPPYPPGTIVGLSTEQSGVVISHNLSDPCRPVVQVLPDDDSLDGDADLGEKIDLAAEEYASVQIVSCNDQPTAQFNFAPKMIPGNKASVSGW